MQKCKPVSFFKPERLRNGKAMYLDLEVKYNQLLMEWNKKVNLVSRKKENIYDLIDDSRLFLKYIPENEALSILDLGTGGGIPGVVLAIHRPRINFILADSVRKKTTALQSIVDKLELKNVTVVCSRAEKLYEDTNYKNKFDIIVARSVAELQDLVKWSKNLLKGKGKLLTIKGKNISRELNKVKKNKFVKAIITDETQEKQAVIAEFY
jgi:16S rRNA (guanine527-N7)-methyltransferase